MLRFACRRNVQRMLFLGVALLITVELVKITLFGGHTELDDDGATEGDEEQIWPLPTQKVVTTERSEQIWPFPKRWPDAPDEDVEEGLLPEKTTVRGHPGSKDAIHGHPESKKAIHGHAGSKEVIASHAHAGSKEAIHGHVGSKEAIHGHAGYKEAIHGHALSMLGSKAKVYDHGHAGSKGEKHKEHQKEKERELTEEEELKFLGKVLATDDKLAPDVDKLVGSEMEEDPEEEILKMGREFENGAHEKSKQLQKMSHSNEGSYMSKGKLNNQENQKQPPHTSDKKSEEIRIPSKHTATQTIKGKQSTPEETDELGKNTEEEQETPEKEADEDDDEDEDEDDEPEKKTPPTPRPKDNSDDRIYVDTSRPILNPHPFRYLINASDVCKGVKVFVVSYVYSALQNHKRRARIRKTWGNRTNYPGVEVRVVFFVGQPHLDTTSGQRVQQDLLAESKKYGDIVQENFIDDHRNLSHKGVGALKWVSTYCNNTVYVLKTDDDMFVNMHIIVNHLRNIHAEKNFRRRLMLCLVYWRIQFGPDAGVPKGYFANNTYPPYCSGLGFVVTIDVAIALYEVSHYVPFLALNEVFIGGVLPAALHGSFNLTSWSRTYCAEHEMGIYTHPSEWYKYTFTHTHNGKLIVKTWRGLSKIVANRTIPIPSAIRPGLLADGYKTLSELFPIP